MGARWGVARARNARAAWPEDAGSARPWLARSVLVIIFHLLADPAARCRPVGRGLRRKAGAAGGGRASTKSGLGSHAAATP